MPTYEYICRDCGHQFEIQQSFAEEALTMCPECGGELRKVFAPVGIAFKGEGFYKTDSRAASNGSRKERPAEPADKSSDAGSKSSDPKGSSSSSGPGSTSDSGGSGSSDSGSRGSGSSDPSSGGSGSSDSGGSGRGSGSAGGSG